MSSNFDQYDALMPVGVVADESTGTLAIEWSDGRTTRYGIEWLRWQCPCAVCRGEMGEPGRLSRVTSLTPRETTLQDAQPIGRYGLMLFWADGHHDGIYTFDWLRKNSQDEGAGGDKTEGQSPEGGG